MATMTNVKAAIALAALGISVGGWVGLAHQEKASTNYVETSPVEVVASATAVPVPSTRVASGTASGDPSSAAVAAARRPIARTRASR